MHIHLRNHHNYCVACDDFLLWFLNIQRTILDQNLIIHCCFWNFIHCYLHPSLNSPGAIAINLLKLSIYTESSLSPFLFQSSYKICYIN